MDTHSVFRWYARYFARKRFIKFNYFLFGLGLRGLGVMNYYNFRLSGEEYFLKFFLRQFDLKTVFDVGANEGDYAVHFLHRPDCTIHCFEPNPATFERLNSRYGRNASVNLHAFGLSDEPSEALIYDTPQSDGSHLATLYRDVIEDLFKKDVQETSIALRTLDDTVEELRTDSIDLLKIDTEGNEYRVLLGAGESLRKGIIKIIHFEFNMMNVVSRVYIKDFIDLLTDFNLYRLLPSEMIAIKYKRPLPFELFGFQNIVAIRKDIDPNRS